MVSSSRPSRHSTRWRLPCKSAHRIPHASLHTNPYSHSEKKELDVLSSLGHFLKGSSATLGLTKVKDSCEKIQHYGQKKDEAGTTDVTDEEECLRKVKETLAAVREEYAEVEKVLRKFYAS